MPAISSEGTSDRRLNLLVFSDDWGRHPSSCQHIVRNLDTHSEIHWINTIGMRRPGLNLQTLSRGLGKFRQWFLSDKLEDAVPANIHVLNPWMWPSFASGFGRGLNRRLLARQLQSIWTELSQPAVGITTLPIVADVMDDLPVRRWIYYCVDDFGQWPGLDQRVLQQMEERLLAKTDVVIAVSESLRARLALMGRSSHVLTHGVDLDFWAGNSEADSPAEARDCERPWIVFWGLLDQRMDSEFVKQLALDLTAGTILLVGPQQNLDRSLSTFPRVRCLGKLPFDSLPRLARASSVLIMPYADLPVTRAMQPLKLKEYLATGKPVVVRDLPANRQWDDALDLAGAPATFSALVRERLRTQLPDAQRLARTRLRSESWKSKAQQFLEIILGN